MFQSFSYIMIDGYLRLRVNLYICCFNSNIYNYVVGVEMSQKRRNTTSNKRMDLVDVAFVYRDFYRI
jgi:hypothetical protein